MIASVEAGLPELVERLLDREGVFSSFEELVVSKAGRLVFPLRQDARKGVADLRNLDSEALARDRCAIGELLVRVGLSGWKVNPLRPEEMEYLAGCIGPGEWQSKTGMTLEGRDG